AAHARGLDVAVHLEPYGGRTIASLADDVAHLRSLGVSDFYVYRPLDFPAADWAQLNSTLAGVRMFAQTTLVGFAKLGGFTGVYLSYNGAWGRYGRAASRAYLWRTACWTAVLAGRLSRC